MAKKEFITHYPRKLQGGGFQYMSGLCGQHSTSSSDNVESVTCLECLKALEEYPTVREIIDSA